MSESTPSEVLTYRHRIRLVIDFEYTLYDDRIVVTGSKAWVPRIECTLFLKSLSPNPSTIWTRSAHYQWSVIVLICFMAAGGLVLPGAYPAIGTVLIVEAILLLPLLLPILLYVYLSRKLIRYSQFCSLQGHTVLSVGDAGPNRAQFEPFVNELICRIQSSQNVTPS